MRTTLTIVAATLLLLASSIPAIAQDDADAPLDPGAIEATLAAAIDAVAETDALIAGIDDALTRDRTAIVLPDGEVVELSEAEERLLVRIRSEVGPRDGSLESTGFLRVIETMVRARALDGIIDGIDMTDGSDTSPPFLIEILRRATRDRNERNLASLQTDREVLGRMIEELRTLSAEASRVEPEPPADISSDFAADIGPFIDQRCIFRTGTFFDRDRIDETTVVAYQVGTFDDGGPEFEYTGAFPNPDRYPDEPLRNLRLMDDRVAAEIAEGAEVRFRGAWPAFCVWAVSTCPGTLPRQICDDDAG